MAKKRNTGYPKNVLVQIGRVATTTAFIEQEFIIWASALYAQSTNGKPTENLRMGFGRLLNKWWAEAQKRLGAKAVNKVIRPIYEDLRTTWPKRNLIIHGTWHRERRARYRINLWEQEKSLERKQFTLTLGELRQIADAFEKTLQRLYRYFDAAARPPSQRKSRRRRPGNPRRQHANPAKP
jgi:hypothetical protein